MLFGHAGRMLGDVWPCLRDAGCCLAMLGGCWVLFDHARRMLSHGPVMLRRVLGLAWVMYTMLRWCQVMLGGYWLKVQ